MNNRVLFLGITNHCASRFAEIMFNHIASEQLLSYYSVSRGVMVKHKNEAIDPRTINALMARGIPLSTNLRTPTALRQCDLNDSEYIILVSGKELAQRINRTEQAKEKTIINWDFDKISLLSPSELYPRLEAEVYLLIRRLQQHQFQNHITA